MTCVATFPADAPPVACADAPVPDAALLDASVSDAAIAVPDIDSPECVVATASPRRADAMMLFEKYIVAVLVCEVKE